jgi:hypothetical protein
VRSPGLLALALAVCVLGAAPACAATRPAGPTVRGTVGVVRGGVAYAPSAAPAAVKQVIWAGNRIRTRPYVWGGGHASFQARGYDCSGSVSYALHGGGLLTSPLDSRGFMRWGHAGRGRWITVYARNGHAYMVVAGMRFDTSGSGRSRWRDDLREWGTFRTRHPAGL